MYMRLKDLLLLFVVVSFISVDHIPYAQYKISFRSVLVFRERDI